MRAEEITAKALKNVNNDRYKLALMVAKRVEALSNGAQILLDNVDRKMKFADIALLEIAEGKLTLNGSSKA